MAQIEPAKAEPHARQLRETIAAFPAKPFAVVDGGLYEDLPGLFRRERLFARSLFLEHGDAEVEKAGPWLVGLDQAPDATGKVLALVAEKPAAVFWSCGGGEAVLWRHLRTLNMARIPDWAANGGSAAPDPDAPDVYEPVMFRHWDPRVLGALMPVLDEAQFARVLGPAEEIAYYTTDYGGLKRILVDAAWPPAPSGPLTLSGSDCEALILRRADASHRWLTSYLRRYATSHVSHLDDGALHVAVRRYEAQALSLGVRNEDAIARWSYMQATSQVDLSHDAHVVRFLADPIQGATVDARMNAMMQLRTRVLSERYG